MRYALCLPVKLVPFGVLKLADIERWKSRGVGWQILPLAGP